MASVSSLLNPSDGDQPQSSPPSAPLPPIQPTQNETTAAAEALASLSTSPPAQWQDSTTQLDHQRRASGYELPPPTVASRSPEQPRPSAVLSPQPSSITLPPIQDLPSSTPQTIATQPPAATPPLASARRASTMEDHSLKSVALLKTEHSQRAQSPLRESSVPVPSTEDPSKDEPPQPSKKRPAPAKTKKGTAATVKKDKAPPAKKRKVDTKRADTPSSRASKAPTLKGTSIKGTPLNSSPAPSTRSYSAEPPDEQDDEDDEEEDYEGRSQDGDLYCICRRPDTGTFMIGCDGTCDDWFHGKCVNIPERDKNLIDKYICPRCTTAGLGPTTWKRICRRDGCRQPAKTSKSTPGAAVSKYCSEECGQLFYNEKIAQSRGEDSTNRRPARSKSSVDISDKQDNDVGARGGALAAGEVKALLNVSQTAEEFRKLGDGVLSPPATPDGSDEKAEPEYTDFELHELKRIAAEKEDARQWHALFKDRMKFVNLAKQAGSRVANEKELKQKDYCGYDPRIEWSQDRFRAWRNSTAGQLVFESDTLAIDSTTEDNLDDDDPLPDICDRKKCARHLDWSKLAVDDLRHEMDVNGDRMRALTRDEKEVKARAALRTKTGGVSNGGSVEFHGKESEAPAMVENDVEVAEMDVDVVPTVEPPDAMVVDAV